MGNLNRVVMTGNLVRDPETRVTPSGKSVGNLRLAVNRRWQSTAGEAADNTDFFNVVVWDKLAELCQQYLEKGSPIALDGRLQSRSWETAEGQKRSIVEIVAENVQFLRRASAGQQREQTAGSGTGQEQGGGGAPGGQDDFPDEVPF
ncbi:MAG: single-stranded DNA-binding protein [Terriglobia bacterium]